jgi:hypothetical protein
MAQSLSSFSYCYTISRSNFITRPLSLREVRFPSGVMHLLVLPILGRMPFSMLIESLKYLCSLFRLLMNHRLGLLVAKRRISLVMLVVEISATHPLSKERIL